VGLVPSDLGRTYPFNYLLFPKKADKELEEKTASLIISYLEKFGKQYKEITVYICKSHDKIYESLKDFEGRVLSKNRLFIKLIDCSSSFFIPPR
jgi:predicted RNA-binding protein